MHILVVGLSHKTAPVEIREKLTFPRETLEEALSALLSHSHLSEAVILSTCNRTEIYIACDDLDGGRDSVVKFLCDYHQLELKSLVSFLYFRASVEAVHHLFRVAASLDSMIVGEAQILGQVKEAYSAAFEAEATNIILNRLFRQALEAGKLVRTETDIGESAVSISYAAVELAKKVFEDLKERTAMVIGAGEMSELTVRHLLGNGVCSLLVSNRTYERAVELADKFDGEAVRFDECISYMAKSDIVISSTGAPHYVVKKQDLAKVMQKRRNKPIFLIDIAVPRDIDPEAAKLYNVFLYDIDDLEKVVRANLKEREKEAKKAQLVVSDQVDEFVGWLASLEATPTVSALKEKAEAIRKEEVNKILGKLVHLSEKDQNTINALTTVIVNRLLHEPIVRAKASTVKKDGYLYVEALRHLFDLEEKGES